LLFLGISNNEEDEQIPNKIYNIQFKSVFNVEHEWERLLNAKGNQTEPKKNKTKL